MGDQATKAGAQPYCIDVSAIPAEFGATYRRTLAVCDPRSLTREGLVRLLESAGPFRVISVSDMEQLDELAEAEFLVDIAILSLGSDDIYSERARSYISALQRVLPRVPLIFISDHEDRRHVCQALRLNVRGYVSTSLTQQMLLAVLRVVEAGGTFVPVSAIMEAPDTSATSTEPQLSLAMPEVNASGLTQRQKQVLAQLRKGKPNKIIACELAMQESTVKVHVRQIMRKMKVSNRTEAAVAAERFHCDGST